MLNNSSTISHTTKFCMHADHPALAGHFPGRPIVPGVMLLSAVLDYAQLQFGNELRIDGIDQTKFINALLPNQEAQLTITRQAKRLKFSIELGGTLIAQGSLTVAESVSLTTP